jgi:hypothetical protein
MASILSKRWPFRVDLSFGSRIEVSWYEIWKVRRMWKDSRRVFDQGVTDKER